MSPLDKFESKKKTSKRYRAFRFGECSNNREENINNLNNREVKNVVTYTHTLYSHTRTVYDLLDFKNCLPIVVIRFDLGRKITLNVSKFRIRFENIVSLLLLVRLRIRR